MTAPGLVFLGCPQAHPRNLRAFSCVHRGRALPELEDGRSMNTELTATELPKATAPLRPSALQPSAAPETEARLCRGEGGLVGLFLWGLRSRVPEKRLVPKPHSKREPREAETEGELEVSEASALGRDRGSIAFFCWAVA